MFALEMFLIFWMPCFVWQMWGVLCVKWWWSVFSLQSVTDREIFLSNDEIWLYDYRVDCGVWECGEVCESSECVWERRGERERVWECERVRERVCGVWCVTRSEARTEPIDSRNALWSPELNQLTREMRSEAPNWTNWLANASEAPNWTNWLAKRALKPRTEPIDSRNALWSPELNQLTRETRSEAPNWTNWLNVMKRAVWQMWGVLCVKWWSVFLCSHGVQVNNAAMHEAMITSASGSLWSLVRVHTAWFSPADFIFGLAVPLSTFSTPLVLCLWRMELVFERVVEISFMNPLKAQTDMKREPVEHLQSEDRGVHKHDLETRPSPVTRSTDRTWTRTCWTSFCRAHKLFAAVLFHTWRGSE